MKTLNYSIMSLGILLFFACGSSENKKKGLPILDITKSYLKKEVILQDIADVEYIPLETSDSVLIGNNKSLFPVSSNLFGTLDYRSGDVHIFDYNGKFIKVFNHKGQSGREYNYVTRIISDEDAKELYLFDIATKGRIQVYDFDGMYKRTVQYDKQLKVSGFTALGKKAIVCYQSEVKFGPKAQAEHKEQKNPKVVIFSKKGTTDSILEIRVRKNIDPVCRFEAGKRKIYFIQKPDELVSTDSGVLVSEVACDTLFLLREDKSLKPLIVRTPSVSPSENPLKMLGMKACTSDAYYIEAMEKKFDMKGKDNFPTTDYLWDKKQSKFYEYVLKNAEVQEAGKLVGLKPLSLVMVEELKELLEEGKLSGKLKEIAERLADDDNPVLMRVRLKK